MGREEDYTIKSSADLRGAGLQGAILTNGKLINANLRDANLASARFFRWLLGDAFSPTPSGGATLEEEL